MKYTLAFILILLGCACTAVKRTRISTGNLEKNTFTEPYAVYYDSIPNNKQIKNGVYITVIDTNRNKYTIIEKYRRGKLTGNKFAYNTAGQLMYRGRYKRGLAHGWHYNFWGGKVYLASKYRRGKKIKSNALYVFPLRY